MRNITDIDDKIIKRANENGESFVALVDRMIAEMHKDFDSLNILRPDSEPRATHHIAEIIEITEQLIAKGHAYVADNGDVMFDVPTDPNYGLLSRQDLDQLQAGARVDVVDVKRNPMDFVLWKMSKEGEPSWPSPWGAGRPGWHIECSAMNCKQLGNHFDIHGGGSDLMFPHHENEIAQSTCAHDGEYVNYWMHSGMVMVDREKMSKSLGNFFTVRDVLEVLRCGDDSLLPDVRPLSQPAELQRREPQAGAFGAGASVHRAARDGQIRRCGGWRSLRSTLYRGDGRRLQHPGSLLGAVRYGA